MNKWVPIAVGAGIALTGGVIGTGISIYNKIQYDVLSYSVQVIGQNGMTLRIVFGVTNNSNFNVELSNQKYDVFVSGYKIAEITSEDRYLLFANNTSILPLDVDVFWDELQVSAPYIGSQLQVSSIASLPFVLHGHLGARVGVIGLKKIPVRWRSTIGYFLP